MAKTLVNLFGANALFENSTLSLSYWDLIDILGLNEEEVTQNPSPEGLAALLLLVLNKTTRLSVDENGFTIPDNTQSIVSPNTEPRRSFVTRDGEQQTQTRLSFEIYTQDLNQFEPGKVLDGNS